MQTNTKLTIWSTFVVVLILQILIWFLIPLAQIDAMVTIGQVFTVDYFPVKNYFYNTGNIYITGYLAFPFLKIFNSPFGVKMFYTLFTALSFFTLFHFTIKLSVLDKVKAHYASALIMTVMFLPYFFIERAEAPGLFVAIMYLFVLIKEKWRFRSELLIFLTFISFYIHPVTFFTCVYLLVGFYFLKGWDLNLINKENRLKEAIVLLGIIFFGFLLLIYFYFRQDGVMDFYKLHINMRKDNLSIGQFVFFGIRSIPFFVLSVLMLTNTRMILYFFVFVFVILLMMRDFYFIYLIPVSFLILYHHTAAKLYPVNLNFTMLSAFIFSGFFSLINPLLLRIENPEYGRNAQLILAKMENEEFSKPIIIDPEISAPLMFQDSVFQIPLVRNPQPFKAIKNINEYEFYLKEEWAVRLFREDLNAQCVTLIKPVKGLLTFRSLYTRRQESLGLYKCKCLPQN